MSNPLTALLDQLRNAGPGPQGDQATDLAPLAENNNIGRLLTNAPPAALAAVKDLATPLAPPGQQDAAVQALLGRSFGPTKLEYTPPTLLSTAAGITAGALDEPLARRLLRGPLDIVAGKQGTSPEATATKVQEQLTEQFGEERGFALGHAAGKNLPELVGAVGVMQAARSLTEYAMEKAAPRIAELAAPGRLLGGLKNQAQQLLKYVEGSQAADVGQFLRTPQTPPLLYRAGEAAANTAGYTTYKALQHEADFRPEDDKGTLGSAVRAAAGAAALAETGIIAGSAVASRIGRRVNAAEALQNYRDKVLWTPEMAAEWQKRQAAVGTVAPEAPLNTLEATRAGLFKREGEAEAQLAKERVALDEKRARLEAVQALQQARQAQLTQRQGLLAKRSTPEYQARTAAQIAREAEAQGAQIPQRVVRSGSPGLDIPGAVTGRVAQAKSLVARSEAAIPRAQARVARAAENVSDAEVRAADAQVEATRAANAVEAWSQGWMFYPENAAALNRTLPMNPKGVWKNIQEWLLKSPFPIAKSPQDFAGKLGLTGVRFTKALGDAEAVTTIRGAERISHMLNETRAAGRLVGDASPHDGLFMREPIEMYVKGEDQALHDKYGPEMFDHIDRLGREASARYDELVKIGARPKMTQQQLEALGVKRYWPQELTDIDAEAYQEHLLNYFKAQVKRERPGAEAALITDKAIDLRNTYNRFAEPGASGHGSFDHGRYLPGSAEDKIKAGLPFEPDPMRSMERYLVALERKLAYGSRFGYKNELADKAVNLVGVEGGHGAEAIAQSIANIFFNRKPSDMAARRMAEAITSAQIATKMTFSGFVNPGQVTHAPIINGTMNTIRGLQAAARGTDMARLNHAVNLHEGLFQSLRDTTLGGYDEANWLNRWTDKTMRVTGFTPTERVDRLVSGLSSGEWVHDTLGKATTGRLRGIQLDMTRRQYAKLDANLDLLARRLQQGGRLTNDEFDTLVYRQTQLGQFMPDLTRRPGGWNTANGRILSQFNSFAVGQFNMIRNEVLGEAARGNMMPLATLVALYPMAGSVIADTLGVVKGRRQPAQEPWSTIDHFSLVGGLGIVNTMAQAAVREKIAAQMFGPFYGGTLVDTAQGIFALGVKGDMRPIVGMYYNMPLAVGLRKSYDVLGWTANSLEEMQTLLAEDESKRARGLDDLKMQRAQAKSTVPYR